ncbi:thiamine phosphate synthase [Kozakia baliensis]|uniref:thiamine phosphate synthase n=1 Tax=Kozakia baliensis TaxID=153496 RepID=UPI00087BD666|nr:thiamine phosphate synthase [Kozakia baliensis]AOX19064.1 hypothetical protein A0U90_00715 [Kozakia baliensis]
MDRQTMLPCELYLVTLPEFDPATDLPGLDTVLKRWTPSALRLATSEPNQARRIVKEIRQTVQSNGVALILTDLPVLARELECDGVHLSRHSALAETARKVLGDDLQLGIACGPSRDEAMLAGEQSADYIAVTPDGTDLTKWWSQVMELPIVAEDIATSEQAEAMVDANADFLAIPLSFRDADIAGLHLEAILTPVEIKDSE